MAISLILLTACATNTPAPSSDNAGKGSFKIENWVAGKTAELRFSTYAAGGSSSLASSTIAVDGTGNFELPVPNNSQLGAANVQLSTSCFSSAIVSTPSDALLTQPISPFVVPNNATQSSGGIFISSQAPTVPYPVGFVLGTFVYSNKDVALSGSNDCSTGKYAYKANLKAGWNYLVNTATAISGGFPSALDVTASTSSTLKWFYIGNPIP